MAVTMFPEIYPTDSDGRLQVRCRLSEGNLTVAKSNMALGTDYTYTFANQLQGVDPNLGFFKGDKVVSDGIDADGRLKVKKHVYNDSLPVIGEIMTKIDFVGVAPLDECWRMAGCASGSPSRGPGTRLGSQVWTGSVLGSSNDPFQRQAHDS